MLQFINSVFSRIKGAFDNAVSNSDLDISSDEESDRETTAKLLKRRRIDTSHLMAQQSQQQSYKNAQVCDWVQPETDFDKCFICDPCPTTSVPSNSLKKQNKENHLLTNSTPVLAKDTNTTVNTTSSDNPNRFHRRTEMFLKPLMYDGDCVASSSTTHHRLENGCKGIYSNGIHPRRKRGSTALNSIRLEEKEKYRQLLMKYNVTGNYSSISSNSICPNRTTDSTPSNSSTSQRQENGTSFGHHPLPPKHAVKTEKISALDKDLYKRRIMAKDSRRLSFNAVQEKCRLGRSYTSGSGTPGTSAARSRRKTKPVEVIEVESDDDSDQSVIITKEEPPSRWKTTLSATPFGLSHYTTDWLKGWQKQISNQKEQTKEDIERAAMVLKSKKADYKEIVDQMERDIQNKLTLSTIEILEEAYEDEEEEKEELPEITPKMDEEIEGALHPHPPEEVLVEAFHLQIRRRDMETLQDLNWLNDEVINFYMNLLMERGKLDNMPSVYAFNTFFYTKLLSGGHSVLRRWTRKVDIFSHNFMLVPVHLGVHWCLAVVNFMEKTLLYYDSMGGKNKECLKALCSYLQAESLEKKKVSLGMSNWFIEIAKDIPQQMNSSDCGMFACKYAEYITRNSKISFRQEDMPHFRRQMVYEILNQRLL